MSFLIGLGGIIFGINFVFHVHHQGFTGYFDPPSFVLLGILPPSIILLSHKMSDFFLGLKILARSLFHNTLKEQNRIINHLTQGSAQVRREGLTALLKAKIPPHPLLQEGIHLVVHNFTPDEIRHNLAAKIQTRRQESQLARNLFESMSRISPGVGMIGTLSGLIKMMSSLSDPSSIGAGMAMALVTTLYGLILGNIIYGPFGEKIHIEADKMYTLDLLILEGILALKGKKSHLHFQTIVKTYATSPPILAGKTHAARPKR